ncbi:MAG: FCD domain-containing protein [Pseudomonadota bacterium]
MNVREASKLKADEIKRYVLQRIESGEWPPGHRIPTEKLISEQFSAARNTVRKALGQLESQGNIVRHVGRGTFVGPGEPVASSDLASVDASPADINEIRVLLEPAIAELVVARATRADIRHARECLSNMQKAKDINDFEHWDAELHATIISAAKNELLNKLYEAIHEARQRMEWYEIKRRSIDDVRRGDYDRQHTQIVEALEQRDAVALRDALGKHLSAVSSNMLNPIR